MCPALGKLYAQKHTGKCPLKFQEPFGKVLKISFIGVPPFITYNPVGGSDFIVMRILANKFQLIPKYIPARTFIGMAQQVNILFCFGFLNNNLKITMFTNISSTIHPFQVSVKQSELGIGQTSMVHHRYKLVDYLPPMYTSWLLFGSKKPGELTTYDSIVIPFDKYVWAFMFGCICAQFLLLVSMQQLYSIVAGTRNSIDFIYEGYLHKMAGQ